MLVCWIFLLISGNGFALKRATFLYLWNDEMPWTERYLLTHLASHQVLCAILGATLKKKGYKAIREHPEESYEEGDGCGAEALWGADEITWFLKWTAEETEGKTSLQSTTSLWWPVPGPEGMAGRSVRRVFPMKHAWQWCHLGQLQKIRDVAPDGWVFTFTAKFGFFEVIWTLTSITIQWMIIPC